MSRFILLLVLVWSAGSASGPPRNTDNVILITFDGLRWQEVFTGADFLLIRNEKYVDDPTLERFWADDVAERRSKLMPFFWTVVARDGQLYGNRRLGSEASVTNSHWFSYPGYNEILTGYADPRIDSNNKNPNPNVTVLETANRSFPGKVAAFGSWDVFPYIVNEERSGVLVNAGLEPVVGDLSEQEELLNELQAQVPSPWATVRLDAFTHHFAKAYLAKHRPRLLYIAYGETDDIAHDGDYDAYLKSAHQTDAFIADLWEWVQADPSYRNKTTLVITTDHGRGWADEWTSHGSQIEGADAIWIAVLGPDTPALGEIRSGQVYQNQVAATVAALLGMEYDPEHEPGPVIEGAIR